MFLIDLVLERIDPIELNEKNLKPKLKELFEGLKTLW
jgi:hypothetical protein